MKTGDVVEITGAYFKNDNGLFRVEHSPRDADWQGNDYSLIKLNKNGTESKSKYNICSWPLVVYVSGYKKRQAAKKHNAEHAKIRVIKEA